MDFSNFRDTGELSDITVAVEDKEFKLHKFPLYIKSDFFRALARSTITDKERVELTDFPGGPETFELVANYCYNIKIDINKENVCRLRCAAEFLQMTNTGNLAEVTDRFLQDTLTSAKLGRSLGVISDLLLQCCSLGAIAEQANIVDRCINAIVDCWLISSKFSKRLHNDKFQDHESLSKLTQFPLNWFLQLFITARDKSVRPAVLSNMVQMYIAHAMENYGLKVNEDDNESEEESEEEEEKIEKTEEEGKTDAEKANEAETEGEIDKKNEAETKEGEEDKEKKDVGEETEKKEEKKQKKEKKKKEKVMERISSLDQKQLAELAEILDTLLLELPENAPLAENISPQWAARMLKTAETMKCKSRDLLLKLAGRLLHRFKSDELSEMSPSLLGEIVQIASTDPQNPQSTEVICGVVDKYLANQAQDNKLSVDVFTEMVSAMPKEKRTSHDTLYKVLEALLKSEETKITDDEKQKLLDAIDFSKLSEDTLQRAHTDDLVPVSYITKAALNLCAKLRTELEATREVVLTQEKELEKYGLATRGSVSKWTSPKTSSDDINASFDSALAKFYPESDPSARRRDKERFGEAYVINSSPIEYASVTSPNYWFKSGSYLSKYDSSRRYGGLSYGEDYYTAEEPLDRGSYNLYDYEKDTSYHDYSSGGDIYRKNRQFTAEPRKWGTLKK